MSRPLLLLSVALAGYAVLSSVASLMVMLLWRMGCDRTAWTPAARAGRLVMLRALPTVTAAALLAGLVMPAFVIFEPVHAFEAVGPVLPGLALLGGGLLASGFVRAAAAMWATWRIERQWLRAAAPLDFDPPAGVPAYAIDSFPPVVALVGVLAPKLIAARAVIDACDRDELANIVAHEHGHLHARDNLKRWLMACAPDVLRFTPVHHAIAVAWDDAAEDAADDAATAAGERARVDLAALLVKVARLSAGSGWTAATVSPFIAPDRLDRRVRRLLSSRGSASTPSAMAPAIAGAGLVAAGLAALSNPAALETVHQVVEAIVVFGR